MKVKYTGLLLITASLTGNAMTLNSKDIQEGSRMAAVYEFNGFGCHGENISPELSWKAIPQGTKSFAITAYDPDAPTGSGFWHWVVLDIPEAQRSIPHGASGNLTFGKEMKNDYGMTGFGGACPPVGDGMHRYQFTVWALPTVKLGIPEGASDAVIGFMLNANAIGKTTLTATYVRE